MSGYRKVTGKILSRDNYWEDQWNSENGQYELKCFQVLRVEYNVNGTIYTHNFYGVDDYGEINEDYEFYYLTSHPESVKSVIAWKNLSMFQRLLLVLKNAHK